MSRALMMYNGLSAGIQVTVSVFAVLFVNVTISKSLGLILIAVRDDFMTGTWNLGLVFALVQSGSDLLSPGYCLCKILTKTQLGLCLDNRNFAIAIGIARSGSAVGLVYMPPLLQLFLNTYGWRGTVLLTGAISAHLVVCGALLITPPRKSHEYQVVPHTDNGPSNSVSSQSFADIFGLRLFIDFKFWSVCCVLTVARLAESAWLIYFVPHAVAKGFTAESAAVMVTAGGLGRLVSLLVFSVALYKDKLSIIKTTIATTSLMATSFIIDPWLDSEWLLTASAVLFAVTSGLNVALGDILVKQLLGSDNMTNAYGWIGLISGIFRIVAGFFPGLIYDELGSYDVAFVTIGIFQITPVIPLLIQTLYRDSLHL